MPGMSDIPGSALILGGGIMGLSAAWAVARQGTAVRLVEQDPIPNPRGASHDHHRLIRHAYGPSLAYLRMVEAAHGAWDLLWAELGERLMVDADVLALASSPGGWLAESRAALRAEGHAVQDLGPAELARRFPALSPDGIADAFLAGRGGVLLADRILAALLRRCLALGVTVERARAAAVDPGHARLRLADGTWRKAELLLVAAGPWAPRLLPGLAGRVAASRQVTVFLEPPPGAREAWAAMPMLLDLSESGGFYLVPPVAGTPAKIGDHRFSCQGDAEDDRAATPAEAAAILALARPRLRDLGACRVLGARACYYEVEPRERILLEPLGDRAWVLTGTSGHGFKFGPLLGLGLARAMAAPALRAGLPGWAAGEAPPPAGLLPAA
ncbi:FAD-dependent oxidoreductase [Paracraurococcus ruber]|nr:FAD-dependent oxidoreductase [Paracraurococcus ruber]